MRMESHCADENDYNDFNFTDWRVLCENVFNASPHFPHNARNGTKFLSH